MDAHTIGLVIGGILAALGVGAGAGRYLLPRGAQGEAVPAGVTNPGVVNTGQVAALDIVTETECRETRKELTDSFVKTSEKMEVVLGKTTDSLQALTTAVTKLEAKVDNMPTEIENASILSVQGHESRFHGRPATGGYPKVAK